MSFPVLTAMDAFLYLFNFYIIVVPSFKILTVGSNSIFICPHLRYSALPNESDKKSNISDLIISNSNFHLSNSKQLKDSIVVDLTRMEYRKIFSFPLHFTPAVIKD